MGLFKNYVTLFLVDFEPPSPPRNAPVTSNLHPPSVTLRVCSHTPPPKNFSHAGKTLAEVWSDLVIDDFPVVAEYIESKDGIRVIEKDPSWYAKHVRESQYMVSIVKCSDQNCCSRRRSSLFKFVKSGHLPPPMPVIQSENGLIFDENEKSKAYPSLATTLCLEGSILSDAQRRQFPLGIPYDYACPSLDKEVLTRRQCQKCGVYHSSIRSATTHAKIHKNIPPPMNARVRPVRIAARRQRELMCLVANQMNLEDAEYEWINEEFVCYPSGLDAIPELHFQAGTPVVATVPPQWEEDV